MTSTPVARTGRAPSDRWQALVRRYPLITFFALANGISWLAWTPYILSLDGFGVLHFRYADFIMGNQLTAILPGAYLGPLTAAFTVTAITEGRAGLRRWRGRLFRFRAGIGWYAVALLAVPTAIVAGTAVLPGAEEAMRFPSTAVLALYLPMLVLQFFTTGLSEEPGWRDFALTRLQQRHHPLVATLILGALWSLWHFPLFLTPWGGPDVGPVTIGRFVIMAVEMSILITLVYNRGRQSVPLVMLLHCSINNFQSIAFSDVFPGENPDWAWGPALGLGALCLVVIAATRGRLGYPVPATSTTAPKSEVLV
ncbi:type II CAAX endopeptidase family protein [Actinokineospora spheciospongiae]|uniref:type II CAAX endopeptidase family protein n=1 Tax=Actinokineospora spheciospongiae TaxID=909613 RepID=UPI000D717E4A|nr:type II CAAX endopeptidase family protein [Actinokineospora spheciospongiae]PWW58350.1 membrane protease YdiL (CAAX protease family) [Actinokineospora spheciospongiae]